MYKQTHWYEITEKFTLGYLSLIQLKNVQDRVNKEKVWVMKFEQERIKTGKNLLGEQFTASTGNRLSKTISTSNTNQIVVSPLKQLGNVKKTVGRQVGGYSTF